MRVVCVRGDIYRPNLYRDTWNEGQAKQCWLASKTGPRPNDATDVLLCGDTTVSAWSVTWIRDDVKETLYELSIQMQVNFHSISHGRRRGNSWWACKNKGSSMECY
jgi:hypothetical protein